MSTKVVNPDNFPRFPLYAAGALISFALIAAVVGRATGMATTAQTGTATLQRDLVFADRGDGAVVITDADAHREVGVMTGQNGFLRGTMRGLARARKLEGVGEQAPFKLTAWSDGRLTLDDPTTGRHIELEAFGRDNFDVFAHILTMKEGLVTEGGAS